MMTPPASHRRTDARHFARLSLGSAPACAGSRVWPVIAAQIQCRYSRSAPLRQYPRPSFEPRQPDPRSRLIFSNTRADAKSP